MDIEVGQTVYLAPSVKKARIKGENIITEGVLKTVGRKYYTVSVGFYEYKFDKESHRQFTNFAPDYYLYFNKQELLDKREIDTLKLKFSRFFNITGGENKHLTLDQLRRIDVIINENKEKNDADR